MDWRPQSRSRSRSTFGRLRNPYDHGSEAHSHSLLGREDVVEPNPMFYESQMYNNNDFQSWPLGGASLPNLPHIAVDPHRASQAVEGSSINGKKSSNESTNATSSSIGVPKSFDLNQAVRAAAAYDAFATSTSSADGEPLHLTGSNPPSVLTAANSRASPRVGLPGISGPGLYDQNEENFHPQYGYLPRRVRKTSFDHTVEKSSADSSNGFIPPPMTAKQARKRPAEASPQLVAQGPMQVPQDESDFLDLPTADSINLPPGEFPSTAFTFSYPHSYETFFDMAAATSNTPVNTSDLLDYSAHLAASSPGDISNFVAALNDGTLGDLSGFGGSASHQAPVETLAPGLLQGDGTHQFDVGDGAQMDSSVTFQQMMQQYLQTNATVNPFTHINPAQVLGNMGQSSERAISVSVTDSPLAESSPHGPTKQMPRSVGGKPIPVPDEARAPAPIRSNSSPNLIGLKVQALSMSEASSSQSKKGTSSGSKSNRGGTKTGPNTPSSDNDHGAGSVIVGGESPIMCTNCQTTNTPLWRRDPDGQPLCNVSGLGYVVEF